MIVMSAGAGGLTTECGVRISESQPEVSAAVTPSHAAMRNPVPSRNVQLDFIRNVDRIGDDDPSAFVGGVRMRHGTQSRPLLK